MSSSASSNRHFPLGEPDEVRIGMDGLPQTQQVTGPQWQDYAHEEMGLSATPPPPIRLETNPPLRRRSRTVFTATNPADLEAGIQNGVQKKKAVSLPELRQSPSLVETEIRSPRHVLKDETPPEGIQAGFPVDATFIEKPKSWGKYHPYVYLWEQPKDGSWETLKKGIDKYDKEMCDAWNGELDTILTFTGLFSAAITAFCIESIQALSQSSADTTNTFLLAISQQLANSSAPIASLSMVEGFTASVHDVRINVLYFTSLALALSVSSVCILGKQWIREYQKDVSVHPRDAVRIRQARFDSLEAWKVPQIMAGLPVVLLVALILFFSGLLIQLWNVNDCTTAVVVSVVVLLTVVLLAITTIVPACVSTQPGLSSFAPFRSPQAWVFFVLYRKVQRWLHRSPLLNERSPIVSSWAAFDLHFVKSETRWRCGRGPVTSVHRALRWVVEVLRNSSEMEKSLFWCLHPTKLYHPTLIESEDELRNYVLFNSDEEENRFDNVYRADYDYSTRNEGIHRIDSVVGRHQAELLVRSAHCALDDASSNGHKAWDVINHVCKQLWRHGILENCSGQDVVHHQHIFQDQVALLCERIITSPHHPPSHSFNWTFIIRLLLEARRDSSSPLSCQILHNLISQHVPTWIRTHKSPSLLYGIGNFVCFWANDYPEPAIELFVHLDKVMAEFCNEVEGIEGLNEESKNGWRRLRATFTVDSEETQSTYLKVRELFRLPIGHFDNLPGHGPLPSLLPLQQSPSSSHPDIDIDAHQTATPESVDSNQLLPSRLMTVDQYAGRSDW